MAKVKLTKLIHTWPAAMLVFGAALTLVWLAVLLWLPIHLLLQLV